MKKWNTPEIAELNIDATANGYWNIDWESPLDIFFSKKGESEPSTPTTEDVVNPLS